MGTCAANSVRSEGAAARPRGSGLPRLGLILLTLLATAASRASEIAAPPHASPFPALPSNVVSTPDDTDGSGPARGHLAGDPEGMRAFFEGGTGPPARRFAFGRRRAAYDFWFRPEPMRNVAFAAVDTSGGEPFIGLGYKRALGPSLDLPGYRFTAALGVKLRDPAPVGDLRIGRLHSVRVVFGREWHIGRTSLAIHAGASIVFFHPEIVFRTNRGGRLGALVMAEAWHDWQAAPFGLRSSSLFAMVEATSASAYIRMRHAFALPSLPFRLGPEAALGSGGSQRYRATLTQGSWRKGRLGLHASDIALRDLRFSLSGGMEWRSDRSPGAYAELGVYIRY